MKLFYRNEHTMENKTAVITGAARGLGFALSHRLLDAGVKVALFDQDLEELEKKFSGYENAFPYGLDIVESLEVKNVVDDFILKFPE